MPWGGDLGFSSYLVLLGLFVGPLIAFVLRRKWRRSVARREEIRRLLVFASEEAARAELEASSAYVTSAAAATAVASEISRSVQYQCAVCYCPTTTRCARCKSVRYCSGKCQIIHWRQGHKEECRPFTISYHINDTGGGSSQKVLKQEEDEIYGGRFVTNGRQFAESVENFPAEHACFKPNGSPKVFNGNDDSDECLSDGERTTSSSTETERSEAHLSPNISPHKPETFSVNKMDQNGPPSSKLNTSMAYVDCLTSPGNLNQLKPNGTHHSIQHGSTSSSGWSADGTNESSFSEPSTPSSGFWEGTLTSGRPKIDTLDDSIQSSSNGDGNGYMNNSRSCRSFSFNSDSHPAPPTDVRHTDATRFASDGAPSTTLGIKKPIDGATLSKEVRGDAPKGRNSPLLVPEKLNRLDVDTRSDRPVSKSRDPRDTTFMSMHPPNVSSIRSLSLERSNHMINGMKTSLHPLESKEGGFLSPTASVTHILPSSTRRSLQGAVAASSSEVGSFSPNARNGLTTSMRKVVDQLRGSKSSQEHQSVVGSESVGRYNAKGLFPYDHFVKLYNWNKIELRPCGLTNTGNSCYANAVLQCLACTPPLTAYLVQGLHSKSCGRKQWCFTCEFESLIMKAKEGSTPLSPIGILSQIQNIGRHFSNGREEDAHEFLRYAIDTMQSVCLKEAGVHASGSLEEETTLIGLTFGGYLRSKIKCMKCGGKSERHERMMDLTVEVEGDIGTLEAALRRFTGTEILDGENKYHCSRCRSYERAKKKLTILEAPNILTIALKRFQSGKFGKLNKEIKFPEILNLAPCVSGTSDKSPIYRLYGVVVHLDVMNSAFSGHYVCYVKTIQNKWFKIDDSTVKAVDLESVLTKGAYMLLYARCSPRAPRLIKNSVIPKNHAFKSRSHPSSPWNPPGPNPLNDETFTENLYPNCMSKPPIQTILEEDSSSDNSSSIFSEGCSFSSDSTKWDSTSTDNDYFESFFGDLGRSLSSPWRNLSDSDSSSSSSSPSPLYSRLSQNVESGTDDRGFWGRRLPSVRSNWEGKSSEPFLFSDDQSKQCRKSSSYRETNSGRLGSSNPSFRRSTRERTE
ncbi:ubiquitin carboxyl-terminal hydrolase 17 isoform X1 [Rhododendron vialii]|uniref:ubiquitin carboxyl-terminal hydrolase 17 isoform X1 n=1 Tax=Rhododendron vialii TaxID=182163 RepID=UPI0026600E82|nr:ubiquitin carboxyl-terminal hydrolase 17 isoform X1 [Rhododendron vialii]